MLLLSFPAVAQDADGGVREGPVVAEVPTTPPAAPTGPEVKLKFGEGLTVKYGEMKLNLRGRMQFQGLSIFPAEDSTVARQNELLIRRARLALKAELPWHLSFNLQLAFSPLDMELDAPNVLRDLYGTWAPFRDLSVRFGQMKVPFDVQRVVSSSSLQLVDRSTVTAELNLDRDMGLVLFSDDLFGLGKRLGYAVGIFGGDGRNRSLPNVGLLYSARVRVTPFGEMDDKIEGDPDRDPRFRLAIGAAVARNNATNRPRSTTGTPFKAATFDYTHATGDVHAKWRGFSLLSEVYWRQADLQKDASGAEIASKTNLVSGASVTEYSRSGWGYFVQGGAYVTDWLELVARFGDLRPLGPTDPTLHRTRELGGGFNLMFDKHNLKVQTDVFWLDNGEGENGRLQARVQVQVYF